MAEAVLFNIAGRILGNLGSLALQESGLLFGVQDELGKLKDTISTISDVLLDAEEQYQKSDLSHQIRGWLAKLKDAIYEADDLLDEFSTEALQQKAIAGSKVGEEVRLFFSSSNQLAFRLKMGHKIKKIRKTLDAIAADRTKFSLEVRSVETQVVARKRDQTHSYVRGEKVIGREEDKKAIINLLLDSNIEENVLIIPIVGMGGLGKTTLAQLVYNDDKVKTNFEQKLWVCVSDHFDVKVIVEKIIESATNENPQNLEMNTLQNRLQNIINGKKYLLVLDDVWKEDRESWIGLEDLLMDGAKGSRIIVTTRSQKVAKIISTVEPYVLQELSENESWSLFTQLAFKKGQELKNPSLVEIGREIVSKCCGVPLAIRTIGTLLYTKDFEEWESVKKSEFSEITQQETSILPILKLSYDNLPSHLKQCFAYCRLFPKDHIINVEMLIYLWMGQGFIKPLDRSKCLKEIGLGYFKDLLWRSFFQEVKEDEFGNATSCKMHDLMHDLAVLVAGIESTTLSSNVGIIPEKTRHVSIDKKFNLFERKLLKENKIRTFIDISLSGLWGSNKERWGDSNFDAVVSNYNRLRVLSVGHLGIERVSQSIEKLKHLRYLNLSGNEIEVLPSSITRLQNLVILNLSRCYRLKELPEDIDKLISLKHLDIEGCNSLSHMPHGLGQLTSLETLTTFIVSNRGGLNDLKGLNSLRGKLSIERLNLVKNADSEYNAANLKEKEHLQSLMLRWGSDDDEDVRVDAMSMEGLQPHRNLKKLVVSQYAGVMFPAWLSFLTNLVNLQLEDCERVKHLPPLDGLTSLCKLNLQNCERLEHLPPFDGLTSLCNLNLENCERLEHLPPFDGLTSLCNLNLENCERLKHLPPLDGLTSLRVLTIENLTHLEYIHCNESNCCRATFFSSLEKLKINECPNLKGWKIVSMETTTSSELPPFPCLSRLEIKYCPNLTSMPLFPSIEESLTLVDFNGKLLEEAIMMKSKAASSSSSSSSPPLPLSKLKFLWIHVNNDLEYLPHQGMHNLTSPDFLSIGWCNKLLSLEGEGFSGLISLRSLRITQCQSLKSISGVFQHLISLRSLHIERCESLKSISGVFQHCTALEKLWIRECSELDLSDVAIQFQASRSLRFLSLEKIPKLVTLPEWLQHFTTLQHLHIYSCSNLTALPEWMRRLTSLQILEIVGCPHLSERCGNNMGVDRPNIAHIPNIQIDLPQFYWQTDERSPPGYTDW